MTSFKINFDFNTIENEGGESFADALATKTDVVDLSVNVGTRNFGYPGFNAIALAICKLTKIENLVVKLPINKVGM